MLKFLKCFFEGRFSYFVCVFVVRISVLVVQVMLLLLMVVKGCCDRLRLLMWLEMILVFIVWVCFFIFIIRLGFMIIDLLGQFLILVVMVSCLLGWMSWMRRGESIVWLVQMVVVQLVGLELMIRMWVWWVVGVVLVMGFLFCMLVEVIQDCCMDKGMFCVVLLCFLLKIEKYC